METVQILVKKLTAVYSSNCHFKIKIVSNSSPNKESAENKHSFKYDKNSSEVNINETLEVNIGDEIKVYVNLIYSNGRTDIESTESICVVQNIEEQSGSARAKFLCSIENLESGDYYSLRYNNSDSICGVPNDEILLDPVLTNKYKNNEDAKILPTFIYFCCIF